MPLRLHHAEHHPTPLPGVEAVTLVSTEHFPRHSHDQFGIGVISSGGHKSWSGIGHVSASPGDVIMCNPGEIHDGSPLGDGPRKWRMIYFNPSVITSELPHDVAGPLEILHPVATDSRLAQQFARLFSALTTPRPDALHVEQNVLSTLIAIVRNHSSQTPLRPSQTACVRKAIDRIESAPAQPVSLAELAALSGVSRFQLLRSFARFTGITPHAFIVQRRVRLAQQLLTLGRTPAEAAIEAGFSDQSHMTRAFARQLGITPSRYQSAILCKTTHPD